MDHSPPDRTLTAFAFKTAAIATALLGFLPIVNWIAGGHSAPNYQLLLDGWLSGTAICLGAGVVFAILTRRRALPGIPLALDERAGIDPVSVVLIVGATALYLVTARTVFGGRPLLIDEIIQVFQARIFASGRLWLPTPSMPEFTSSMLLIDTGKVYGQFPAGGPAMLAIGSLIGQEWLVGPVAGVVSAWAFARLLRRIEPQLFVRRLALGLFVLAPFVVFMSGSHMNHVTATMWLLLATTALFDVTCSTARRLTAALTCGVALGMAATIRPVDAAAFALPAALWLLTRAARRPGHWHEVLAAGGGVALPMAALFAVNWATTGAPLRFGYTVMWGASQGLGFHSAPWGQAHTPLLGLELLNLYFLRLQGYLFETPFPSLLPAIAWLGLGRRHDAADRFFLASGTLMCLLYAAYWHDGFYLGPRFLFPLAPILALYTARAITLPMRHALVRRALGSAMVAGMLMGLVLLVPIRIQEHESRMASLRWDPDAALARAGVKNAVVLVRESWGSELLARLWAAGVSRPAAEHFYASIDACQLDLVLGELEQGPPDSTRAITLLLPLTRDSAHLVPASESIDPSLRRLPSFSYPVTCERRLQEDHAGFTVFAPTLLSLRRDVRFIRDLHARDSLQLRDYTGPVYLLKPAGPETGVPAQFYPVAVDSLWSAWRLR